MVAALVDVNAFIRYPWISLLIATVFGLAYLCERYRGGGRFIRTALIIPAILWAIYWAYEQFLIGALDSIRIDLVIIYPLLSIATVVCVVLAAGGEVLRILRGRQVGSPAGASKRG